jgi:twitching motility protein PilT
MPSSTASLDQLLDFAGKRNASDILLVAGVAPVLRVNGGLVLGSGAPLEPENIRSMVLPLLAASQLEELQKRKSVDLGFVREGLGRFRINLHHQRYCLPGSLHWNRSICRNRSASWWSAAKA